MFATSPVYYGFLRKKKSDANHNIGKDFWIKSVLQLGLCDRPVADPSSCQVISKGRVHVDGTIAAENDPIAVFYRVTVDDGRMGYILTHDLAAHATGTDPVVAAAECKRRGDPHIGMTAAQVTATCWGKPEHVNRTELAGSIQDQYVYGDGGYVYLRNGIVTSIQASGTLR